jgi:hypothetical protein
MKIGLSIGLVFLSSWITPRCTALITPFKNDPSHVSNLRATTSSSTIDDDTFLKVLAGNLANCLICSDTKRMTGNDGASTGWTSWVDEKSSFRLQKCFDRLCFEVPMNAKDPTKEDLLAKQVEAHRWMRWMKNSPSPLIIEVSESLRLLMNETLDDRSLEVSFS